MGSKWISLTYFFVMTCSRTGVTKVKKPTTPHMKYIMGAPPNLLPCSMMIGWAAIPVKLVVIENTFTAFMRGVRVP